MTLYQPLDAKADMVAIKKSRLRVLNLEAQHRSTQHLMEASPLTRQLPPEVFTPKVIQLYESLFKDDDDDEKTEGFWAEFFLLRPDRPALRRVLNEISPSDALLLEGRTRELFARAIETVKVGHGAAQLHALDTLSVFLSCFLSKKYNHPSSDIMIVLAGLDHIDTVFTEFVGALEGIIRNGKSLDIRYRAIEVLLAVTAGAYQTTLLTYLIQRDLFPSFIQESDSPDHVLEPFTLLGLLANYNKFEFQNPYQQRLNDFVNEGTIQKIVRCVGNTCSDVRTCYLDIQEDLPEGWTFTNAMHMIGLGVITPGPKPEKKPVYDPETAKRMFTQLPGEQAAVLLATYDFTHANKLFCFNLVTYATEKGEEQPIASYLSLTSYLLQHAHLSERATCYAHLNLMVFRLLIEDPIICKRICSDESKVPVRLCRQRQPYLPLVKGDRVLATSVLDTMVDGINHNLRRRLDVGLYTLCLGIMLRIISYLSRSRTRLAYHWSEFFRSLLSIIRFLATYTSDLKDLPHIDTLLDHVVNLVALSLSAGEAFLPTPAAYDDLFYKVVESGEVLTKFKENYRLANRNSNSIDTLINVSTHYKQLLSEGGGSAKKKPNSLTTQQVTDVIKQGYESLSIQAKEGLDTWDRYREADERTLLKKMARAAVGDVKVIVER
ncbi:Fc.00g030310.m01.CDS01 [Cosmosporella sp. VM-42]